MLLYLKYIKLNILMIITMINSMYMPSLAGYLTMNRNDIVNIEQLHYCTF